MTVKIVDLDPIFVFGVFAIKASLDILEARFVKIFISFIKVEWN